MEHFPEGRDRPGQNRDVFGNPSCLLQLPTLPQTSVHIWHT